MTSKTSVAWLVIAFSLSVTARSEPGEFSDPRDTVRHLITTLQNLKSPVEVTTFKHLFDPNYFKDGTPEASAGTTEPRAIGWKLPTLPKGKILWIATDGDGDVAMAAIRTARGIVVFSFALTEIRSSDTWRWVIRPPGKQNPFDEILLPWHNRRTIEAEQAADGQLPAPDESKQK